MIIIGPPGSGKTQLFLNSIMKSMKWDKLYLIVPSVDDQRCYDVIKDFNESAKVISEDGDGAVECITVIDESPNIDDINGSVNNLVVYDDEMLNKQTNPARILSRGRHKSTDVIYVTQRYAQIPKVIIDNCNNLAVFNGVDTHTLGNIHQTWSSGDIDINKFRNFFSHAQSKPLDL